MPEEARGGAGHDGEKQGHLEMAQMATATATAFSKAAHIHQNTDFPSVFAMMNAQTLEDLKWKKFHIAENPAFHIFRTLMVVFNILLIGYATDQFDSGWRDRLGLFILDVGFAFFFFCEMLIQQNQLGWDYFLNPWNTYEYFLVLLSFREIVIALGDDPAAKSWSISGVLRVARFLRVVRVIEGMKMFRYLWITIECMLVSRRTITWVAVLSCVVCYAMAVTLTSIVHADPYLQANWAEIDQYTGTVGRSMMTALQIMTMDRWITEIARPIAESQPWFVLILVIFIILSSLSVMNVIIGVMVERVLGLVHQSANMNAEVLNEAEQNLMQSMAEDFKRSDASGDGVLQRQEFKRLIREPKINYKLRLLGVNPEDAEGLFDLMDCDESGSLSPEEFIAGLHKLQGPGKGADVVQLICFCQFHALKATRNVEKLRLLNRRIDGIQERLDHMGKGCGEQLKDRKQAQIREAEMWENCTERQALIERLGHAQQKFPSLMPSS